MSSYDKCIVTTTIYPVSESLKKFAIFWSGAEVAAYFLRESDLYVIDLLMYVPIPAPQSVRTQREPT